MFLLILATIFFTTLKSQPPIYCGTGIYPTVKKGKLYYTYSYGNSPAVAVMPKPSAKKYQILKARNSYIGREFDAAANHTAEEFYAAVVGPEGSTTEIYLKMKGSKNPVMFSIPLSLYHDPQLNKDIVTFTLDENNYIKVNFPYNYASFDRPANADKDSLNDDVDRCPKEAGPVSNQGCPTDFDKDGVLDIDDKCKTEPGPAENQGCPYVDSDGDGILDKDDYCKTERGLIVNNGCPDYDDDGMAGNKDECPCKWGTVENGGCPDVGNPPNKVGVVNDYDDLMPPTDLCPQEEWGTEYTRGCAVKTHYTKYHDPEYEGDDDTSSEDQLFYENFMGQFDVLLRDIDNKFSRFVGDFSSKNDKYTVYTNKMKFPDLKYQQFEIYPNNDTPKFVGVFFIDKSYEDCLKQFNILVQTINEFDYTEELNKEEVIIRDYFTESDKKYPIVEFALDIKESGKKDFKFSNKVIKIYMMKQQPDTNKKKAEYSLNISYGTLQK